MDEDKLDEDLKSAMIAYFEGWELVELLEVPIELIVELLEDYIIDNIEDIEEEIGYSTNNTSDDGD